MKQVTLNIPDNEFDFFMKLIQKFNYKTTEPSVYSIPEQHKSLVRDRIENSNAAELLDWDNVKDDFDGV
ncbi:MAG: hypothetical protein WAQ28_12380 [Bacteroidia bacterium]|jgi:hypothetical protein